MEEEQRCISLHLPPSAPAIDLFRSSQSWAQYSRVSGQEWRFGVLSMFTMPDPITLDAASSRSSGSGRGGLESERWWWGQQQRGSLRMWPEVVSV